MSFIFRSKHFARLIALNVALLPLAAGAQTVQQANQPVVQQVNQPVVQPVPGAVGMRLNDALGRLAKSPQDVEALLDAGKASLELGDVQAAVGFYQRAATLAPGNAQVKAGLAGAYVLSGDPFTAIPLFNEAAKAGPIEPARLVDRGLAYDLVGDNRRAQGFYREALAAGPRDEALRRMALSLAISGDAQGMDAALAPLLQRQDRAAWRDRTFGFAILGRIEEAEAIAHQIMPANLADSMAAYLRYMPRLTRSQQAAAANLGRFPRAAMIGQDDPRVAQFASAQAGGPVTANTAARVAPPEPRVGREVGVQPVTVARAAPPPVAAQPAFVPPPPPPARVVAAPAPKGNADFDALFADFSPPSRAVEPQAGAVDVRRIDAAPAPVASEPAKARKAKEAKRKPKYPSRVWVQVATGRNKKALATDWNKLVKAHAKAFKGRKAYVAASGRTNRMVTGPFDSDAEAKAFLAKLRKAGVDDAFPWTSDEGEAVDPLAGAK